MLPRHQPDGIHIAFDDHRLVNNAGLILPATLASHLGLPFAQPAGLFPKGHVQNPMPRVLNAPVGSYRLRQPLCPGIETC